MCFILHFSLFHSLSPSAYPFLTFGTYMNTEYVVCNAQTLLEITKEVRGENECIRRLLLSLSLSLSHLSQND